MQYELNRQEIWNFEQQWIAGHGHDVLVVTEPGGAVETRVIGEIFDQPGWLFWMQHIPGKWDQPEARDAWAQNDPRRVRSGQKAAMWFTFWRCHHAGMQRTIPVLPGQRVTLSYYAHAWSNGLDDHLDDPYWSDGAGRQVVDWLESEVLPRDTGDPQHDASGNVVLRVGIHPAGGQNALDEEMIWSPGRCIYNGYSEKPIEVSCVVPAGVTQITAVVESTAHYPYKHLDIYVDDARITIEDPVGQQPAETGSKLGLHILRNAPGVAQFLAARPAVALFDTDLGLSGSVPAGTLCIGAISHTSFDAQSQYNEGKTPEAAAMHLIETDRQRYEDHRRITHWTGYNEPVWTTPEQMAWYAQEEIERIRLLGEMGLRAVIGEFSTGTPRLDQWREFVPALRYGADHGALLGLHEYSCPWMWWLTGKYQVDPAEDQGDEGWTTLRYRKVHRQVLIPNGIDIQIVITECGIDPLVNPKPAGAPDAAWKDLGDYWREYDGAVFSAAAFYVQQLIWYDEELRKDDYVLGAAVFCAGNYGSPWSDFDIADTPVIDALTHLVSAPGEIPVLPVEPPIDTGCRGAPREQYERTYVLLPPGAGLEWWQGAASVAASVRWTMGGSADDAGIGDLDIRWVLAVNPEQWPGDLRQFYADYYPGIELIGISGASVAEMYYELLLQAQGPLNERPHLWMRDPRWADHNLGGPTGVETIGTDGCVVSVLGDLLRYHLRYRVRPDVFNNQLNAAGVFYSENHVDWALFADQFSDIAWIRREDRAFSESELEALLDDLQLAIILSVAKGTHFVYLISIDDHKLRVFDPIDADSPSYRAIGDVSGIRLFRITKAGIEPGPDPDEWPSVRGVHGAPVTFPPADQGFWVAQLQAMGIRWYKDMSCDVAWCSRLLDAGIEPVVRLYQGEQFPGRLSRERLDAARRLAEAGVTYFEIGNEPNLPGEWQSGARDRVDWHNDDVVAQMADNWWLDAQVIAAVGGKPGLYAMAPTERGGGTNERYSSVEWLQRYLFQLHMLDPARIENLVALGDIWMAMHVSPFDRPLDYDPYTNGAHPDDMCLRAIEIYAAIAQHELGTTPLMISTEGGLYSPEHLDALGWSPYSEAVWAARMPEMFDAIQQYPYVLGMCPWILTDLGVADDRWRDNGWYRGLAPRAIALALRGPQ